MIRATDTNTFGFYVANGFAFLSKESNEVQPYSMILIAKSEAEAKDFFMKDFMAKYPEPKYIDHWITVLYILDGAVLQYVNYKLTEKEFEIV